MNRHGRDREGYRETWEGNRQTWEGQRTDMGGAMDGVTDRKGGMDNYEQYPWE